MQTAKHVKMPANGSDNSGTTALPGMDSMNPAAMASSMLAMVDPTTTVSVRTSAYVAGRAAYELVLMPKSAASTVGEVVLAIDDLLRSQVQWNAITHNLVRQALYIAIFGSAAWARFTTKDVLA